MGAITELDLRDGEPVTIAPIGPGSKAAEAVQALQALGYDQTTINSVMKGIDTEHLEVQDIIKQALRATMQ